MKKIFIITLAVLMICLMGTSLQAQYTVGSPSSATGTITNDDFPTVSSIVRKVGSTNPTNASTVTFTVTFSHGVTGVNAADFDLTKTSTANGTIGTPTGSGTTWEVPITSISGAGTLRLDLDDDNTIVDATHSQPLGGTMAGDGDFTGGETFTIDRVSPTAMIVLADTDLKIGETSLVTITFSEIVTGFANVDLTIPNGTLTTVSSSDGGKTYTATFTPTADIEDATNVITLANTGVTDAVGNVGVGTTDSGNFTIDTKRPTATIALDDIALKAGETATVTITFSEIVTGFANADLTVSNGTLTTVSSSNGGTIYTATFTPTADIEDATNVITLANTLVTDVAGNAGTGTTDSDNFTIDTKRPTATIVLSDTDLTRGETATVTITFSEKITGFANGDLTISNGTLTAVSSADGGTTYTATFTPTADIEDATNVITLANTGVTDVAGNTGTGTTDSGNFIVNTKSISAAITLNDAALKIGETATVTITFTEAATGFTNADLTIPNGTLTAVGSTDGNKTFTATFTPTADVEDATNMITLDNTGVTNSGGNAGTGTSDSPNFTIDTKRPTATIALDDTALKAGETALVTITFSEVVTGFANADLTIPNGTLTAVSSTDGDKTFTATFTPTVDIEDATNVITLANTGVTDEAGNAGVGTTDSGNFAIDTKRPIATISLDDSALKIGETATITITFSEVVTGFANADLTISNGTLTAVSSADGGTTYTATFTPTADVEDATNVITLANTGVMDAAGNTGTGTTDSDNFTIDTKRPTATIALNDTALKAGETATVTITFSEIVTGFANADLTIPNGTLTTVSSADGGTTYTATFTPTADVEDATNMITLANTGVTDVAGNAGVGTTDSGNFTIDTKRPTATIGLSDTQLTRGETATVTITFTEIVTGFSNADLTIPNGTLTAVSSTDGGTTYTATFTPTADIADATNVITLANTGVTDVAGNAGVGTTDSDNFTINTKLISATIMLSDAALKIGETATVTITFTEVATGFTNADLTIPNGTLTAVGSTDGNKTFTATFTPTADVEDATNVIILDNTGVTNSGGNAGTGTSDSPNFTIDTKRPTTTIALADAALKAGETALVTITFSEIVTGFANADLTILNGTLTAVSSTDGDKTFTATFTPTVDTEDATNVIILANTGVMDVAGNAGVGTTDSGNFAIDTKRPTATIVLDDSALKVGETATVTITFSEVVTGFANADLTIPNGTLTAVSSTDGGTTYTATFTPTADVEDATNVITLANTGVMDAAGNTGVGTTDSGNFTIDTKRPTATIALDDTALKAGETATVTITFSEVVTGFANADLTIPNGTLTTVSSADGGTTYTATYTPTSDVEDATNMITLANTGVTDVAGNAGVGTTDSGNFTIDTKRPTATVALDDTALKAGETATVTITFSEIVTSFANTDLTIPNGTLTAISSADGGKTYTATFTPTADIEDATNVITLTNTGVTDVAGNAGVGTTDSDNFTIETKLPTVTTLSPADDATDQSTTTNLVITFSENVEKGTGNITIHKKSDDSVVETIDVTNAIVSISGATATINPANTLVVDTEYYIQIANTAFKDIAGNNYAGISNTTDWSFETIARTITISAVQNSPKLENATGTIDFTFTADVAPTSDLTINYTVSGTATNGTDYGMLSGMVILPTGMTTVKVEVDPTGDTNIESDETVILTLASGINYAIGTTKTQTGTISNDDFCPTLGTLTDPADICAGSTFNLSISGLDNMASANNGNQDFGIKFVAFTAATADPYTGGTLLGTVTFANLMGTDPNQTATLNNVGNSLAADDYIIYAILSAPHADASCRPSKNINLTVKPKPVVTGLSASAANICTGGTATISLSGATALVNGAYEFTYNIDGGTAATAMVTIAGGAGSFTVSGAAVGSRTVNIVGVKSNTTTCEQTITGVSATFEVKAPTTALAGADQQLCGKSFTLQGNTLSAGTGLWTFVNNPNNLGVISNPTSPNATISYPRPPVDPFGDNTRPAETFTVKWTTTNSPCPAVSDDVVINFTPNIEINAGSDNLAICGTTKELVALIPAGSTGAWTITNATPAPPTLSSLTNNNSTLTGVFGGEYTLRWTANSGICNNSFDEIQLKFVPDVDFVNPNGSLGDGVQDCVDLCIGGDDRKDSDGLGMPDDCDCSPGDTINEFVTMSPTDYQTFVNEQILLGQDTAKRTADYQLTSNAVVEANTGNYPVVIFRAGHRVKLEPGFHAKAGSEFIAKLEYCRDPLTGIIIPLTEGGLPATQRSLEVNTTDLLMTELNLTVHPNPINQTAAIKIDLPETTPTSLILFNHQGQALKEYLQADMLDQGAHYFKLDASQYPSGFYYLQLHSTKNIVTKKIVIQR